MQEVVEVRVMEGVPGTLVHAVIQGLTLMEDVQFKTHDIQGCLGCQHLLYPDRNKEKVEKPHLFLNHLGLQMPQITDI